MIRKILIGLIYIFIYVKFIIALYAIYLFSTIFDDPSAQAIKSLILATEDATYAEAIIWGIVSIISIVYKKGLRLSIMVGFLISVIIGGFLEFYSIKYVAAMTISDYYFINYIKSFKTYIPIIWLILIWLYLYKIKTVASFFENKTVIEDK